MLLVYERERGRAHPFSSPLTLDNLTMDVAESMALYVNRIVARYVSNASLVRFA